LGWDSVIERIEKPILKTLLGQAVEPRPIWLMRQAGRYLPEYRELRSKAPDFLALCLTPALAAEITLQPIRRFGFDAAILFADILLIPHALGQRVWFEQGEGPKLDQLDETLLKRLQPENVATSLAPVFETIARVKSELPKATALIGFAGAPWTVATYMIAGASSDDSTPARLFALRNPQQFASLIDILVESTSAYLIAQINAGTEVLQLFESWAATIPADHIDAYSIKPLQRIVARVREHAPNIPIIVFPRGAGANYPRYAETDATAISLDTHTSFAWARKQFKPNVTLQGNLDPLTLIAGGNALTAAVDRILADTRNTPHIFNLGHGIRPETPVAHVEHLVRQIRDHRA
jgi:uroporphyrinogen decarboxylase